MRLVAHLPYLRHVSNLLLNQGALEYDQHEEGEDGVVPVLVQTPQTNTENLKNKEWCSCSFNEKLFELWYCHVHDVVAKE